MRHSLMNPAFPDIVGEWAAEEARKDAKAAACANDNEAKSKELFSDPLVALAARAEIEATRLW